MASVINSLAATNSLVKALDSFTTKQCGENGHIEYGWSNDMQEKIVQFNFQLTRTSDVNIYKSLSETLSNMLNTLQLYVKNGNKEEKEQAKINLSILYCIIGHTRDIIDGKGEYTLSYMMVYTWYKYFPELAKFALKCFVDDEIHKPGSQQYGSWKDLKYFCEYCRNNGENVQFELIQYSIYLINTQLKKDLVSSCYGNNISLVAKWTPREKSSFGWLYDSLATDYFDHFLTTAKTETQLKKAVLKCKTEYRTLLSTLNRYIDTVQIKQCGQQWSEIDFNKVTSISLTKQKKAFLNIRQKNIPRYPENKDRNICAENFKNHIQRAITGEIQMKGKRVSMTDFTKQALSSLNNDEIKLINSQWRDNASQNGTLGKMIAMVDVSGSMSGDPINAAIALGIRIAEKSDLGNRVMTFSSQPTWVNLDCCKDNFIDKVKLLNSSPWGTNTNFHAAFDMILDAIVENKLTPEEVEDMILVILSDMQMDEGDKCNKDVLYKTMEEKYANVGLKLHKKPYRPPHILFWNLRSTDGFPVLSSQKNTSMMSGFSPTLLNQFCDQGMESLKNYSPWNNLVKSLDNNRYDIMKDRVMKDIFF